MWREFPEGFCRLLCSSLFHRRIPRKHAGLSFSAVAFGILARLYCRISVAARLRYKEPVQNVNGRTRLIEFFFGKDFGVVFVLSECPCPEVKVESSVRLDRVLSESLVFCCHLITSHIHPEVQNETKRKHYCTLNSIAVSFIS
jgi:hypothetical protein